MHLPSRISIARVNHQVKVSMETAILVPTVIDFGFYFFFFTQTEYLSFLVFVILSNQHIKI